MAPPPRPPLIDHEQSDWQPLGYHPPMEFVIEQQEPSRLWTWRLQDRFGQALALAPKAYFDRAGCLVAIAAAKAGLTARLREIPPIA